ncbi:MULTISPECIES: hypothetical protein [unclassified Tolypothrix]|nr:MULTISPECIES: hypothetical protein [unclassified Tolypothrix]MBE9086431.1 hypothetical protein [Tolypothrix sp. LEGE 11397]UYD33184.1 hypothetical protein HG267_30110 [Tolypothrix sp. PCC 7601]
MAGRKPTPPTLRYLRRLVLDTQVLVCDRIKPKVKFVLAWFNALKAIAT